jgi:hypothetical protein
MAERAMKKARPTRKILDVVKEREIATVSLLLMSACGEGAIGSAGKAQAAV